MNHSVEEWLIVALCCDAAPEFRSQHLFSEAYSGPEQRRYVDLRLNRSPRRSTRMIPVAQARRADTALAA